MESGEPKPPLSPTPIETTPEPTSVPVRDVQVNWEKEEFIIDGRHFPFSKDVFTIVRPDGTIGKGAIVGYHPDNDTFSLSGVSSEGKHVSFPPVPFETFLAWQEMPIDVTAPALEPVVENLNLEKYRRAGEYVRSLIASGRDMLTDFLWDLEPFNRKPDINDIEKWIREAVWTRHLTIDEAKHLFEILGIENNGGFEIKTFDAKVAPVEPVPEPAPMTPAEPKPAPFMKSGTETETEKAKTLAELRRTIENTQRIIDEEKRKIEERKKIREKLEAELVEIRRKPIIELPEDIKNFIDDVLRGLEQNLKTWTDENSTRMIESTRTQVKLLKSDPIKYFTKEREHAERMLSFSLDDKKSTEAEKQEFTTMWTKEIKKLQRVIDALKAINPEK